MRTNAHSEPGPTITSERMHVRVRGPYALFTRPEYRTERVSSIVGSHAAWEGLLSQVMGHRGCRFLIERVGFLFVPRYVSFTSNEIHSFGSGRRPVNTQKDRTLRTSTFVAGKKRLCKAFDGFDELCAGVDYLLTFRFSYPEAPPPRRHKYLDILESRLRSGRNYGTHPYLGMRELACAIEPVTDLRAIFYPEITLADHPDGLRTADFSETLGLSFYGTDWDDSRRPNYFAPLDVVRGIVRYPSWSEVRKIGIKRENAA